VFVTESELRELWQNGRRPLPAFPPGTRFSPAARDFLKDHGLEVRFAPQTVTVAEASAPSLPPALRARLESLGALRALAAAQARAHNLPALAAALEALAGEGGAPVRPTPQREAAAGPPALTPDHAIVHWLRLLRAEARAVAALDRAAPGGPSEVAAQVEALAAAVQALEAGFLEGSLGWRVNP
jgi:hypothetical protein